MTAASPLPPSRRRTRNLRRPNLGLQLNKNAFEMDPRALIECRNVRVKNGDLASVNMGWEPFPEEIGEGNQYNLDSEQVLWIHTFETRAGSLTTLFANQKDLFYHDAAGPTLKYLTPIYAVGTVTNIGEPSNQHFVGAGGPAWATQRLTAPVTGGYGDNVKVGMEISFGSAVEVLPTATWFGITTVNNNNHLIIDADPGVIAGGTAYTIRQTLSGDNFDLWDGETFPKAQTVLDIDGTGANRDEDTIYITNGIEMLGWDGNNLTAWWFFPGFVARRFQYHRQIMMASFIDESGERKSGAIKTSRLNFPEDFATEEATEFVSANGNSEIRRLQPLGDSIAAYYERDIEIITFVGPPLFWLIRSAIPRIGIISAGALADFGSFHEILSHDRAYQFDGVSLDEAMPQVMREILRRQAPNRAARAYVHLDEEQGEAIWSIPLSTDGTATDAPPVSAFTNHYLEAAAEGVAPPVMQRDFPFTAAGEFIRDTAALRFVDFLTRDDDDFSKVDFSWDDRALQAAFPFSIAGDGNGNLWILSTKSTKGTPASPFTDPVPQSVTFPYFALIDGEINGHLHWVEPLADAGGNVYDMLIEFDAIDRYRDSLTPVKTTGTFDLSHDATERSAGTAHGFRRAPFRSVARYGKVRLQNDAATKGSFFFCSGYRVAISPMGER